MYMLLYMERNTNINYDEKHEISYESEWEKETELRGRFCVGGFNIVLLVLLLYII